MRQIMICLSDDGHAIFRANVGLLYTKDGRPMRTGLPVGFSDLWGFTRSLQPFFLEVKTARGRVSSEQAAFLKAMSDRGAIAAVVRSVDDARQALRKPHQTTKG